MEDYDFAVSFCDGFIIEENEEGNLRLTTDPNILPGCKIDRSSPTVTIPSAQVEALYNHLFERFER